jgi:hypothetical protein
MGQHRVARFDLPCERTTDFIRSRTEVELPRFRIPGVLSAQNRDCGGSTMVRPKKPREQRRLPLAVYLPEDVLERLRDMAARDRRSASTQALLLIERALEEAGS